MYRDTPYKIADIHRNSDATNQHHRCRWRLFGCFLVIEIYARFVKDAHVMACGATRSPATIHGLQKNWAFLCSRCLEEKVTLRTLPRALFLCLFGSWMNPCRWQITKASAVIKDASDTILLFIPLFRCDPFDEAYVHRLPGEDVRRHAATGLEIYDGRGSRCREMQQHHHVCTQKSVLLQGEESRLCVLEGKSSTVIIAVIRRQQRSDMRCCHRSGRSVMRAYDFCDADWTDLPEIWCCLTNHGEVDRKASTHHSPDASPQTKPLEICGTCRGNLPLQIGVQCAWVDLPASFFSIAQQRCDFLAGANSVHPMAWRFV